MANPTIGATTPRIQYTATASQTVFTVPFEFLANADLAVYVNGTLKTLTTDYTLTGANTTGGGSLTFVTGRTAGEIVTILGDLAYSRDTNKYTKYGLLPAEVLEADFDAMQVQVKQLARDGQFALRAPLMDTGTPDMVLPAKATRATKVLGFDSDGDPVMSASSLADIDATVQIIDTLNALPAGASSSISYQPAGTGAVATTVQAKLRETVSVKDFGAVGNGTTDDTAAIQAALDSGALQVIFPAGGTYITTGVTASTVNQVIAAHGATVKLKASVASGLILTLAANYQKLLGGTWDGNRATQSGTTFSYRNIHVTGDYCEVAGTVCTNSKGIGISGGACDYVNIHQNQSIDCAGYGIYVESVSVDSFGNWITDNRVTNTTDSSAYGIYLSGSNSPFTYKQYNWRVSGNIAIGPTGSPTGVGITVRGIDGIASENSTEGWAIGLSADITSDSVINGNRCYSPGGTGYCIEVNGDSNTIAGNKTRGGLYSLAMSIIDPAFSLDNNTISGNNFESPGTAGIYALATGANSGIRISIIGNTIRKTSGTGGVIRLTGNCQYANIVGNHVYGPGSATAGTRGIYLDSVNSNVSIVGNVFIGLERAVACYNNTATAYTDMMFNDNDCRNDVGGTPIYFNAEGTATIGARTSMLWNKQNTTGSNNKHYFDYLNLRFLEFSNTYATPESNVTSGIGSLFVNTNGGAGTTLFVKQTGTGNTGWAGK